MSSRYAAWVQRVLEFFALAGRMAWPIVDKVVRLHLAQAFLVSAVIKLSDWDTALALARNEYPVPWMSPDAAAVTGVAIELVGGALLVLGLATRPAAMALLMLTVVSQIYYVPRDSNLFWMALLGWYVFHGAGPWSVDRLLARGLADSALPLAGALMRVNQWLTAMAAPIYRLLLRTWLAAALAVTAGLLPTMVRLLPRSEVAVWLPVSSLVSLAPVLLTIGAIALAIALASRAVAMSMIVLIVVGAMHDPSLTNEIYWIYALAFVAIAGPGPLALDGAIRRRIEQGLAVLHGSGQFPTGVPRVVIVGAGFAGVTCAEALRHEQLSVTLIDRHNYHLFQPLLYQVATTMLAPNDIAAPIRTMFRDSDNTRVLLGEVTAVDTARQSVSVASAVGTRDVDYDYLVIATGASHSYFGRDEWAPFAPGLKRVEDATEVRRRLLSAFELAEGAASPAQQRALLTFVIVGGGPTGVELAGAIAELARHGMTREFRHIDPASARVMLVQAAPRLLPAFAEPMSHEAKRALERIGVEVRLDSRVEQIDGEGVVVNGERIESRAVFWAAGVVASPAARWLNAKADPAGRVCVNEDLSVGELANVFVVGDTALSLAWEGKPVPGLAPAAKQQGAYVASLIAARVARRKTPPPFRYRHLGSLATIGRKAAVADFGRLRLSGTPAWWLWGVVHVAFLAGLRNRLSVVVDWFWAYLTFRSGTRLITGEPLRTDTVVRSRPAISEIRERLTAM